MSSFIPHLIIAFAALGAAWPNPKGYVPEGAECKDYKIPVTVTSENYPWDAPTWTDDYGFIDFSSVASSRVDTGFPPPVGAPVNETASYEISATFCTPKTPHENSKTVLLATHGLAFDRSYWNSAYKPDQYNFVQYATARGYSTFFYDRLGVGASTRLSGFKNQLNIQTAILLSLSAHVRAGTYTGSIHPTALVLVGHSFGSFLSHSAIAADPSAADAVILTGYGLNGSDDRIVLEGFSPRVAALQSPSKFGRFDPGYITTGDVYGNINNFFKAPAYEHDVAAFSEATKQPFAIAELVSLALPLLRIDSRKYTKPALVISGEFDYIVCGGYCPGELEASFAERFAGSKGFETYVQPASGHGTNFARNATGFYGVIFEYLGRNGL